MPSRASSRHEYEDEKDDDERINIRQRHIPPHPKEVRIEFPPFHGRDNVEAYLDWVAKVEQLFESHFVEEERRVSLATLNWWTSLVLQRRRKGLP